MFVSTPAEERGWYRQAWERGNPKSPTFDPAWRSWRFPTASNPFIAPEEIAEARLSITEVAYRREFLAEFVSGEGAMVKGSDITVVQPPADLEVVLGVDLAISERAMADYTALAALGKAPETIGEGKERKPHPYAGHTWTLWVKRGRWSFKVTQDQVIAAAAKWSPRRILIESVAYQAAAVQELLRTTALPVRAAQADRDKVTRFQPVAARYEHKLHHHAPGLEEWYEDEVLAFPIGEHDDGVDATAYAFRALMQGQQVEAMVA
jgi:predicted phage terminase large subunit-like protein